MSIATAIPAAHTDKQLLHCNAIQFNELKKKKKGQNLPMLKTLKCWRLWSGPLRQIVMLHSTFTQYELSVVRGGAMRCPKGAEMNTLIYTFNLRIKRCQTAYFLICSPVVIAICACAFRLFALFVFICIHWIISIYNSFYVCSPFSAISHFCLLRTAAERMLCMYNAALMCCGIDGQRLPLPSFPLLLLLLLTPVNGQINTLHAEKEGHPRRVHNCGRALHTQTHKKTNMHLVAATAVVRVYRCAVVTRARAQYNTHSHAHDWLLAPPSNYLYFFFHIAIFRFEWMASMCVAGEPPLAWNAIRRHFCMG